MSSPHPPLTGIWLDIARALYQCGPTPRLTLRLGLCLTNKQLKTHSKLMKLRNLIDAKDGVLWITAHGEHRLEQTLNINTEPGF